MSSGKPWKTDLNVKCNSLLPTTDHHIESEFKSAVHRKYSRDNNSATPAQTYGSVPQWGYIRKTYGMLHGICKTADDVVVCIQVYPWKIVDSVDAFHSLLQLWKKQLQ